MYNHGDDRNVTLQYTYHSVRYNKPVIMEEALHNLSQENVLILVMWLMKWKPHRLCGAKQLLSYIVIFWKTISNHETEK